MFEEEDCGERGRDDDCNEDCLIFYIKKVINSEVLETHSFIFILVIITNLIKVMFLLTDLNSHMLVI